MQRKKLQLTPEIHHNYRSPNHGIRKLPIDFLVLHYTGMQNAEVALQRLCCNDSEVSAHYLIDESGVIFSLVDESARAWHAGISYWQGIRDMNSASLGIELVNPGHEFGLCPFPQKQMLALAWLCQDIMERYPSITLLAHSDIAPARKTDPGELFDWRFLEKHGVGIFPPADIKPLNFMPAQEWFEKKLQELGYGIHNKDDSSLPSLELVIQAFHRRYYPAMLHQPANNKTAALLQWLLTQNCYNGEEDQIAG